MKIGRIWLVALAVAGLLAPQGRAASTFGNFHTMGVLLNKYKASNVGQIRLYQISNGVSNRLVDAVQVGATTNFAASVFNLAPGSNYQFKAEYYGTSAQLLSSETFSGSTRAEMTGLPAPVKEIHVAITGNDANAGTAAAPLRTIGAALQAVKAGYHVVIHGGTYYEGDLEVPDVGTSLAPVVIRVATNETPVMDGSDPSMFSSGWTSAGNGYYYRAFAGEVDLLCFRNRLTGQTFRAYPVATMDEMNGKYIDNGGKITSFSANNITAAYNCSGTTLTIYCPQFTPGGNVEMRVPNRSDGFYSLDSGSPWVIYQGLTFQFYPGKGVYFYNTSDVTVRSCTFQYVTEPIGIKMYSNRILVENSRFVDDSVRWGFLPKSYFPYGWLETGCVYVHQPYEGRGLVVRGNYIDGIFDGAHVSPAESSDSMMVPTSETDFYSNTVVRALDDLIEVDGLARNVRVFRNTMGNSLTGISIAQAVDGPVYILYNTLINEGNSTASSINSFGGYPIKANGGTDWGDTGWVYIYHNTAWTSMPDSDAFRVQYASWRKLFLANNIWCGQGRGWNIWQSSGLAPTTMTNDIVYQESGPFLEWKYQNYDTWSDAVAALPIFAGSIATNPLFINAAGSNFNLSALSPARDAGVLIPGINDHNFLGGAPDIGAHEFVEDQLDVTLRTVPVGLQLAADNATNIAPWTLACDRNSQHVLAAVTPQPSGDGGRYAFAGWTDAVSTVTRTVMVTQATGYSAVFAKQYHLSTVCQPVNAGTITPDDGNWLAAGMTQMVVAAAEPGWRFDHWTGALSGTMATQSLVLASNTSVTAVFMADGIAVTVNSQPAARLFLVDGRSYSNEMAFSWVDGSIHTADVAQAVQPVAAGTRAVFTAWNSQTQSMLVVTARVPQTLSAVFDTEYLLSPAVNPPGSGTVTPVTDQWCVAGERYVITAAPALRARFLSWVGDVSGITPAMALIMDHPLTVTANFQAPAPLWYVDHAAVTGSGDGLSWSNAFLTVRAALQAAQRGDEIWIAQGVYRSAPADNGFIMKTNVTLYGGFAGTERTVGERNIHAHPVVLSGDVLGDDIPGVFTTNRDDNAGHTIWGARGAVLDGLTISGGHAHQTNDDWEPANFGGGLYAYDARMVARDCVFTDNSASLGGGALFWQTNSTDSQLIRCVFHGNRSVSFASLNREERGGGLAVGRSVARFTMDSCVFEDNGCNSQGGGAALMARWPKPYSELGTVVMSNCLFIGNQAVTNGGGIFLQRNLQFTAVNCVFKDNLSQIGGGVDNSTGSNTAVFVNCVMWGNQASTGSAVAGSAQISNSIVEGGFDGTNIITSAPVFKNAADPAGPDGIYGTLDDGLQLMPGSPGVDMGVQVGYFMYDMLGVPRPQGAAPDVGAYEVVPTLPGLLYILK